MSLALLHCRRQGPTLFSKFATMALSLAVIKRAPSVVLPTVRDCQLFQGGIDLPCQGAAVEGLLIADEGHRQSADKVA